MSKSLTYWNPARLRSGRRFDQFFDRAFGEFLAPLAEGEEISRGSWNPAIDIYETDESVTLNAELPGLTKNEVNISLEDNTLSLSGERKFEKKVEKENYHRIERAYGSFTRSFTLPSNVVTDKVEASFKNGVLTVVLPKSEDAKPRKIAIK